MKPFRVSDLGKSASGAVLDQLSEGVIITDGKGAIVYINEAARRLHGCLDLELVPEEYSERYDLFTTDGDPYPLNELPLTRAVRGETVEDASWIIRRPDGSEVYAVGNAKPLLDGDGRQSGAVLTIRDETQWYRTQSELRASEDTVRAFFETAGIYTAVIDVEESDFRLVMGNGRMAAAFGQERIEGQSGRTLLGDARADPIVAALHDALSADEPVVIEYPWPHRDGERWFVATITAMRDSNCRLFLASLDITDRKEAERDLAQALETKDVLLHEVNHRVKNSLQIITSLLKLQERLGDGVLREHLREARSRVETVARVHERLYDTSSHDKVDIVSYLEDLLTHVVASVGPSGAVEFAFSSEGGDMALGVEHSVPLALILVEVAMNAAKYAFPAGRSGRVEVSVSIAEEKLYLVIRDDGVGMGEATGTAGTGLGQRIVGALAAQLHAETCYLPAERGTAFQLIMPLPGSAEPL